MIVSLPLESMSAKEKLQIMEMIWEDLCKESEQISSPSWHKNVLEGRENNIVSGKDKYVDWEVAKKQIRNNVE